jgi:NADH:ubiquinone oxidoreductase subunit H
MNELTLYFMIEYYRIENTRFFVSKYSAMSRNGTAVAVSFLPGWQPARARTSVAGA